MVIVMADYNDDCSNHIEVIVVNSNKWESNTTKKDDDHNHHDHHDHYLKLLKTNSNHRPRKITDRGSHAALCTSLSGPREVNEFKSNKYLSFYSYFKI